MRSLDSEEPFITTVTGISSYLIKIIYKIIVNYVPTHPNNVFCKLLTCLPYSEQFPLILACHFLIWCPVCTVQCISLWRWCHALSDMRMLIFFAVSPSSWNVNFVARSLLAAMRPTTIILITIVPHTVCWDSWPLCVIMYRSQEQFCCCLPVLSWQNR